MCKRDASKFVRIRLTRSDWPAHVLANDGPEETTCIKQGVCKQELGECSVNGGDGKLSTTVFENLDRRSFNDGSRELIPIFHNPHQKCRSLLRRRLAPSSTLKGCPVEREEGKKSSDQYPKCP